jgi:ribosome-binding factor A
MAVKRTDRLNSLLREVISEVIHRDVKNPHINTIITVTRVDITKDLHFAKVFTSVIGTPIQKEETIQALQKAAGFIAVTASKKVTMRYFPELTFKLDDGVDKQMRIEELLKQANANKSTQPSESIDSEEQDEDDDYEDDEDDEDEVEEDEVEDEEDDA